MRNLNWICCNQCVFIRVHFAQTYKQCQKYQSDDRWPQRKMEGTSFSAPSPPGGGLKHNSQIPRRRTRKLTVIKNLKSWNLISFCCYCVFISLFINIHFINQVNLAFRFSFVVICVWQSSGAVCCITMSDQPLILSTHLDWKAARSQRNKNCCSVKIEKGFVSLGWITKLLYYFESVLRNIVKVTIEVQELISLCANWMVFLLSKSFIPLF